ncbi:helix-turn-helix transcriptional regulator [Mucilaginibacter sp. 14171R-50]|uniref:AraC family transcriptional regulator n=1 Tax=Mucilaginibacter sp. 14171R-50 TaxID=2703789 RepID=UPI00138C62BA|nr:AraC family transcriptional regulator [Mucilaginibacter sp. 14171R-50]QHS56607.1 helix-turn-helix transcriptional regulator [Mucilaginibacter sp. 14171R-50]
MSNSAPVLRSLFFYTFDDEKHPFFLNVGIYPINELLLQMIKHSDKWEGQIRTADQRYQFLVTVKNILPEISTHIMPMALPTTDNERMLPVLSFMAEHLSEPHNLENISKRFGFSNRSLSRLFKATLGVSFLQYLTLLRMVKAFERSLELITPYLISLIPWVITVCRPLVQPSIRSRKCHHEVLTVTGHDKGKYMELTLIHRGRRAPHLNKCGGSL